jgi:hypothetical protein
MRNYIILIFSVLIFENLFAQDWSDKFIKVDSVNFTKSEIYDKAKLSIAEIFNSPKTVVQFDDKDSGKILIKAAFETQDVKNGFGSVVGSNFIDYTLLIEIKDYKYRITISDHNHKKIGRFDGEKPPHPSGFGKIKDKQWTKYKVECAENAEKIMSNLIAVINKKVDDF